MRHAYMILTHTHLVAVAGSEHEHIRQAAQTLERLHGLMRGAVLAETEITEEE